MNNDKFDGENNRQQNAKTSLETASDKKDVVSSNTKNNDIMQNDNGKHIENESRESSKFKVITKSNAKEEKRSLVSTIIVYTVCFVVALVMSYFIASANGAFKGIAKRTLYGVLSDSFLVPGALFVCVGLLLKISETGFFDSISFILKRTFLSLIPGGRVKLDSNYKDYKKSKEERRKKARYSSMLIVGLIFLVLSILFLILYSNTKI